jgi:hypothetical protein
MVGCTFCDAPAPVFWMLMPVAAGAMLATPAGNVVGPLPPPHVIDTNVLPTLPPWVCVGSFTPWFMRLHRLIAARRSHGGAVDARHRRRQPPKRLGVDAAANAGDRSAYDRRTGPRLPESYL